MGYFFILFFNSFIKFIHFYPSRSVFCSIFENYFRYAGRCVYNSDLEALKDYGEYCFLALTYAPESFSSSFIEIDNAIRQRDFDAAIPLLEQLNLEIDKLLRNP